MTARIVKVQTPRMEWYLVQLRFLWFIWIDVDVYRPGLSSVYLTLDEALESLNKIKKPKQKRKVECTVKF
jgi:hypothetical protein